VWAVMMGVVGNFELAVVMCMAMVCMASRVRIASIFRAPVVDSGAMLNYPPEVMTSIVVPHLVGSAMMLLLFAMVVMLTRIVMMITSIMMASSWNMQWGHGGLAVSDNTMMVLVEASVVMAAMLIMPGVMMPSFDRMSRIARSINVARMVAIISYLGRSIVEMVMHTVSRVMPGIMVIMLTTIWMATWMQRALQICGQPRPAGTLLRRPGRQRHFSKKKPLSP